MIYEIHRKRSRPQRRKTSKIKKRSYLSRDLLNLPTFEVKSFKSDGLKSAKTFASFDNDVARVAGALMGQGGMYPLHSREIHFGVLDFSDPTEVSLEVTTWVMEAASYICSQPRDARRRAYEEKSREFNEFRSKPAIQVAEKIVKIDVEDDDLGMRNPIRIQRVLLDIQAWQSRTEQMLIALHIIIGKGRSQRLPGEILMRMLTFILEPAEEVHLIKRDPDETSADIIRDFNMNSKVRVASSIVRKSNANFCVRMSERIRRLCGPDGIKEGGSFLEVLQVKIREHGRRDRRFLQMEAAEVHDDLFVDVQADRVEVHDDTSVDLLDLAEL